MAHKVIVPQKKIMSRSFLNSGTLIVILPFLLYPSLFAVFIAFLYLLIFLHLFIVTRLFSLHRLYCSFVFSVKPKVLSFSRFFHILLSPHFFFCLSRVFFSFFIFTPFSQSGQAFFLTPISVYLSLCLTFSPSVPHLSPPL